MERRKFLKITGIGVAGLAALPIVSYSVISFENTAVNLILDEYPYLKIHRQEAEKFVAVYYERLFRDMGKKEMIEFKAKLKVHYFSKRSSENSILIKNLTENFLFASDFFVHGMDEKKPVAFMGLYNPYKTPCLNPFSHLYYPG